jgi:hypothetical protein
MVKISISLGVYRRIQPRDASFWANFCGVFYSNDHVANYMQLHMVTAERFFEFLSGILFAPPNIVEQLARQMGRGSDAARRHPAAECCLG